MYEYCKWCTAKYRYLPYLLIIKYVNWKCAVRWDVFAIVVRRNITMQGKRLDSQRARKTIKGKLKPSKKSFLIEKAGLHLYVLAMLILLGMQAVPSIDKYLASEVCVHTCFLTNTVYHIIELSFSRLWRT